jgi:arylsulfatase A-like enzyme
VQDVLAHLDATIGRLLTFLDEKVGAGNYVLGLSADHGVADVPEQVADGARVLPPTVTAAIESAMKPYFGDGPFVASNLGADVYLKPGVYAKLAANRQALGAVRKAVLSVPGVARVITSGEVARPEARRSKDALVRAVALSYYPGRSGDLIVITKPDVLFGNAATTHGTPQPYDQHVPVILFGQGIKGGVQAGAATPADLVATLASMIGVKLPSPDGRVLGAALAGGARRGTAR